jgi:hypothetical protein
LAPDFGPDAGFLAGADLAGADLAELRAGLDFEAALAMASRHSAEGRRLRRVTPRFQGRVQLRKECREPAFWRMARPDGNKKEQIRERAADLLNFGSIAADFPAAGRGRAAR